MIIIEPFGGLANRMRVIASGLWLQDKLNCKLICFWLENKDLNSPFNLLFENINELSITSKHKKYNYVKATHQEKYYKKIITNGINKMINIDYCLNEADFLKSIRSKNKKIDVLDIAQNNKNIYLKTCEEFGDNYNEFQKFKPISALNQKINEIAKRFNKNTIGLHIRRTDHAKSIEMSPTELFLEKINFEISRNNNINFFLSTDDFNVEKQFIEKFGKRIITYKKEISRQTISGMQDAVVDMFCLSKTAVIYGSYWSSFSNISSRIGKIPLVELRKQMSGNP